MSLLVIDGKGVACRNWYAAANDPEPPDLCRGVLGLARRAARAHECTHWVVAWEMGRPSRCDRWPAYKQTRMPKPEGLANGLRVLPGQLLEAGLRCISSEGAEADDVMATFAARAAFHEIGSRTLLMTRDKDLLQVVDYQTHVLWPTAEGWELTDSQGVQDAWGVDPDQMPDVLALMGDSTDNVPGVPKIGRKTATELVQRYGSLEEIYRRLFDGDGAFTAKQRAALIEHRDLAFLSRELVKLRTDVPLLFTWDGLCVPERVVAS